MPTAIEPPMNIATTVRIVQLEQIFQCELHDSRIQRRPNLAEVGGKEIRVNNAGAETIQHVVRFRSKFEALALPETECARDGQIELPGCRHADSARLFARL